jgi:hypothetical protein
MKTKHFEELIRALYPTVEPGDDGDGGGGGSDDGGTGDGGSGDDDGLGDAGKKTLQKLRAELKAAERRLKAVEGLDPKVYQQATTKAEELERQLREREALTEAEKLRLEQKHGEAVAKAMAEAERERSARLELQTTTAAREIFSAAKGRSGGDEEGLTYFETFMAAKGRRHLRLDETSGKVFVVDAQGDPVLDDKGSRVDPIAWMKGLASTSPVIGALFQGEYGEGSGTTSSNGVRGVRGQDFQNMSKSQLFDAKWGG